jgi:hypothetical protein
MLFHLFLHAKGVLTPPFVWRAPNLMAAAVQVTPLKFSLSHSQHYGLEGILKTKFHQLVSSWHALSPGRQ